MYTPSKRRRAISGLLQVAMIIGIVVIFAGALFSFAGEIFDVQTVTDSISLQKVYVHNVGGESYVSANVKNTGNSDITNVTVRVMLDTDAGQAGVQPFEATISPSPLSPGLTGSVYARMVDSNGDAMTVPTGGEVAVLLEANAIDGSQLVEPVTVRAR